MATGRVEDVTEISLGSQLVADTSAGTTSLAVLDVLDFNEPDEGETIDVQLIGINGELNEVLVVKALNDDTSILTCDTQTQAFHSEGTPVRPYPEVTYRRATVRLDDADEDLESIFADIPHALWDKLDTGIRSTLDQQEVVDLDEIEGEWLITDVRGQIPAPESSFVSPQPVIADTALGFDGGPTEITTTSESYVYQIGQSPIAEVFVTTSASGRILIMVEAELWTDQSNVKARASYQVARVTQATTIEEVAPNDRRAAIVTGTNSAKSSSLNIVSGLPTLENYRIRMAYRTGAASASASFRYRRIIAIPL